MISEGYMRAFQSQAPTDCGYTLPAFTNGCGPGRKLVGVGAPTRCEADGRPSIESAPADMAFTDEVGKRIWVSPRLDMPDAGRATIADSGPYRRPPEVSGLDLVQYINQPTAPAESYSGLLAPGQCAPMGYADENRDGLARLVLHAPRVVPGTLGMATCSDGGA